MTFALLILAVFLLICLTLGLVRVVAGPTATDSMLAAQLVTTTGVAFLAILAQALSLPALIDVSLVLALLSAVASVAYVRAYGALHGADSSEALPSQEEDAT